MTVLLDVEGVSGGYRSIRIVHDVAFKIAEGETLALLGRNGVGKTSLLRILAGLADRHAGEIRVGGKLLKDGTPADLIRLGVAFVPDTRGVFPRLTVAENMRLSSLYAYAPASVDVFELFPDLQPRMKQTAGSLSGGLQQQLAIARAIAMGPRLLIIDELTQGLQPSVIQLLVSTLRLIAECHGLAILLVDQNPGLAMDLCSDTIIMEHGRIAMRGSSTALAVDAKAIDLLTV
jgi:ABC-type branched-subunit amino acid transport system ATPase component